MKRETNFGNTPPTYIRAARELKDGVIIGQNNQFEHANHSQRETGTKHKSYYNFIFDQCAVFILLSTTVTEE